MHLPCSTAILLNASPEDGAVVQYSVSGLCTVEECRQVDRVFLVGRGDESISRSSSELRADAGKQEKPIRLADTSKPTGWLNILPSIERSSVTAVASRPTLNLLTPLVPVVFCGRFDTGKKRTLHRPPLTWGVLQKRLKVSSQYGVIHGSLFLTGEKNDVPTKAPRGKFTVRGLSWNCRTKVCI